MFAHGFEAWATGVWTDDQTMMMHNRGDQSAIMLVRAG
jgi:hypothetical protein